MVSKSIVCWFWLCIQYCWSLSAVLSTVFVFCLLCVFSPTTVFVFLPQQQGHSPYPTVHTELFIHSLGDRWPVAIHNIIVIINIVIVVKDIIIILMFKLSWGPLAGGHTQHYLSRRYPHHHLHTSHMGVG